MKWWVIFGLIGQLSFSTRFIIQWICSEKKKESYIPIVFWYFSLFGGSILLIYASHIKDPVFITGQTIGLIIYLRNLVLISSNNKRKSEQPALADDMTREVNFEYQKTS